MTRASLVALTVAASLAVPLAAQHTPAANPKTLTVDFTAYGPGGAPVFDLKPEEVQVRIGSRERTVRALELVRLAGPEPAEQIPPPFASSISDRPKSRSLLIVLDDESIRPGREDAYRPAIAQLMASLASSDRVAVVSVPLGGLRLDFTTDHARARAVFNTLGGKAPRTETSTDFACRSGRALDALAALIGQMGAGESAVSVLYVASSLSGPTEDRGSARNIGSGMCQILPHRFEQVATAAAQARATFLVLQPEDQMIAPGTVGAADLSGSRIADLGAGLEHLAGVTGGDLLRLQGPSSATVERMLRESTTYYLATLDVEPADRGVARIDVKTSRPGVTIRARPRIALSTPNPDAGRKTAVTPRDMLRQTRAYGEFGMRAMGFVSSNPGDTRLRLIALAEVEPGAQVTGAAVGVFDSGGKMVAQWTARPEEISGSTVMGALTVPPGAYRMRVAVTDATGRAATADYDLNATLVTAGPITMSSLVLGVSREGSFMPRMLFSTEPTAIASVELMDVPAGVRPTARFEIARTINGPALSSSPGAITPGQNPTRATVSGALPLAALAPGDYVIRVIVSTPNGPSGRVMRTLRKVG